MDVKESVAIFGVVSSFFAGKLTKSIYIPLQELEYGVQRVRNINLYQSINYGGDIEFETVCEAFNEMQQHILEEQKKNKKYEKARTDMTAGISYDLKTLMTAIRGLGYGAYQPNTRQDIRG